MVVALAAAALLVAACGAGEAAPAAKGPGGGPAGATAEPVSVRTAVVGTARAPRIVRATGSFRAEEEVTVAAEASGRIVEVARDVGDVVVPGDLLARVDDTDAALARAEKQRALAETLARLGLDALPEGEPDLEKLPSVERSRLEAENAKARFERARTLHERTPPLISDQDFADLRTEWSVAESGCRVALLAARTQLAEARTRAAQLDLAERGLRLTVHRVPDGKRPESAPPGAVRFVVATRSVAVGDFVRVGDPLFRLVDVDPLELVADVPERRAEGVAVGRPVAVFPAGASKPVEGRVSRIRPEIDARSRSVEVEVLVPNPEAKLLAGAFATAEIDVGLDEGVVVVPAAAVRTFAGVRKVFVVDGGKAAERVVVTGRRLGDAWEIVSGPKPGDTVVLDPPANLVAGVPVRAEGGSAAGPGGSK